MPSDWLFVSGPAVLPQNELIFTEPWPFSAAPDGSHINLAPRTTTDGEQDLNEPNAHGFSSTTEADALIQIENTSDASTATSRKATRNRQPRDAPLSFVTRRFKHPKTFACFVCISLDYPVKLRSHGDSVITGCDEILRAGCLLDSVPNLWFAKVEVQ